MNIKDIINYILEQRKDLTESKLWEMIEEKKAKIGAGYLTDQGALFLVASELGINIDRPTLEVNLKDLYAGARDLNLIVRILKIYPIKKLLRRDGSTTLYRVLIVYDNYSKARLNLWDNLVTIPDSLGLKVGDAIRLNRIYTKASPDGTIRLNANNRSNIEYIKENVPHIPTIDRLSINANEIVEGDNLVIDGVVSSPPRITFFTNKRGEENKLLHMKLSNIKVVVWNLDDKKLPKVIMRNDKLRLIGFKTKRNRFGELELHGDEGSALELLEGNENEREIDLMQLRIVNVVNKRNETLALAINKSGNTYLLSIINEPIPLKDKLKQNIIIECVASKIFGSNIIIDEDSYIRIVEDESDIPEPSKLEVKINNIKPEEDRFYFLDAIVLIPPKVQNIQIGDENIRYAETLIGDDTGEIKLVGWRDTVNMIENLTTGKRIKVYGVNTILTKDGNVELRLKPFSKILMLS